jgi:hypothetical protein
MDTGYVYSDCCGIVYVYVMVFIHVVVSSVIVMLWSPKILVPGENGSDLRSVLQRSGKNVPCSRWITRWSHLDVEDADVKAGQGAEGSSGQVYVLGSCSTSGACVDHPYEYACLGSVAD